MMQEVELPSSFTNVRCQGVRRQHTCMQNAPVIDLPHLFLHSDCTAHAATGGKKHAQEIPFCSGPSPPALHCKRTNDASNVEEVPSVGTLVEDTQTDETQAKPADSRKRYPQPSRVAQNAVCEYVGMLACGLVPAHAMLSHLGTSIDGEVNIWSWDGLMAGSTVTHAVQACMDKVLEGTWPWACVLLHGFRHSPFAWKEKDAADEELQRLVRVGGRKRGHLAAAAGESVGTLLLLPGNYACLIAMSGAGDHFCKF